MAIECERWEWCALFASEHGPKDGGTRLVLFALSLHMNQQGGSCFSSQKTIADRSGLSERSVRTHLANAEKAGWLKIGQQPQKKGTAWFVHNYVATIPEELVAHIPSKPWEDDPQWNEDPANSAGRKAKRKRRQAANSAGCMSTDTVEPVVEPPEQAAILTEEAANSSERPGKCFQNTRQGLPTNSSSNTPINTPIERAVASDRTSVVGNGTVRVSIKNLPKEQRIQLARIGLAKGMNPEDIRPQYNVTVDEVSQVPLKQHGT